MNVDHTNLSILEEDFKKWVRPIIFQPITLPASNSPHGNMAWEDVAIMLLIVRNIDYEVELRWYEIIVSCYFCVLIDKK